MRIALLVPAFGLFFLSRSSAAAGDPVQHPPYDRRSPSSFALIDHARAAGSLDRDTWALYQAYALITPDKLPAHYRSVEVEKCAEWVLSGIARDWQWLSDSTRRAMEGLGFTSHGTLARPMGLDSTRGTAHCLVHFSLTPGDVNAVPATDANGNGTPDYIDTVITVIEHVWSTEIASMGFTAPPPDTSGGDSRYDVYVFNLSPNTYGYASKEQRIGDNPNSPSVVETNAYTSYLALRNNYAGFGGTDTALPVTVAHEFCHAVKNGYDADVARWMSEAMATWCESQVYSSLHDNYQYLSSWFAHPEYPLDANNDPADSALYGTDHWYGSWIFFQYMTEHLSAGALNVRAVLEHALAYDNTHGDFSFQEIGDVLAPHSTTFSEFFREFTVANATRTIGSYRYNAGANYPDVSRSVLTADTILTSALDRHACMYYQLATPMLPNCLRELTVTFASRDPTASLGAQVVLCSQGSVSLIPFRTTLTVPGDVVPDSLFVVVLNFDFPRVTGGYEVRVQSRPREGSYNFTDLGRIGLYGAVNAVNILGSVAGTLGNFDGQFTIYTPVEWIGGSIHVIGPDGQTRDINSRNEVVGSLRVPGGNVATYWGPAGSVSIDTVRVGQSLAYAINDSGYAVGTAKFPLPGGVTESNSQPFIWKDNRMAKLPLFPISNAVGGVAFDINIQKDVLGQIVVSDTAFPFSANNHMAFWSGAGGAPQDLGIILHAERLNDRGQFAGSALFPETFDGTTTSVGHPATGSGGGYSDLGIPDQLPGFGNALGINNAGDVVGTTITALGSHAFLYHDGVMKDLNSLLPSGACWILQTATAISDSGHIAGIGRPASDPGQLHGFLMTPTKTTGIRNTSEHPLQFELSQNYPNPFNPTTTIRYILPTASRVTLKIYNVLGQEVSTLVNDLQPAGQKTAVWNGSGNAGNPVASGVYFYRIVATGAQDRNRSAALVKKMLLVR